MNNNNLNLKKEITILKTWKGEVFEIEKKYEDFLVFEMNIKNKGEDGFNSEKYRRFIKFSSIEDKIGKTLYLSLPEPKNKKELTNEDREKRDEFIKKILEKTYDSRKKKFILERMEILKKLAIQEKGFGMKTTLKKIEENGKEKFL